MDYLKDCCYVNTAEQYSTGMYRISGNFCESKIKRLLLKFKRDVILTNLVTYMIKHIISKQDVLLAIHNFSDLKNLAFNAKFRSSLKFLLIRY